jgi:hypothetical protein
MLSILNKRLQKRSREPALAPISLDIGAPKRRQFKAPLGFA